MKKKITATNRTNTDLESITITFFKAPTRQGKELYSMFQQAMEGYVLRGHPVKLTEQKDYKMMPVIMACLDADVVIFDGSVEGDGEQYRAALELMKRLDHVLIVSRTLLPVNFEGMRRGGAPGIIKAGTAEYSEKMANEDILGWILHTLEHSSMELPRKLKMNLDANDYKKNADKVLNVEMKMFSDSIKRIDKEEGVFVSYLSKYSKFYQGEHPQEPFVEELFEKISEISGVSENKIWYFPPGKISLEFMTAQRRFEIASITNKFIENCTAFWIYDTSDSGLSWWVYGEKMLLAYIYSLTMERCPDIYVVKPVRDKDGGWGFHLQKYLTLKEKQEFLPQLSPYQLRELHRMYINSDPDRSGYEQVKKMRSMAKMPDFLLKVQTKIEAPYIARMYKVMMDGFDMDERNKQEKEAALEQLRDPDFMIESIRSYVYTKEFWESHIIECPICRAASEKQMDPERYMYCKGEYFHRISSSVYRAILKSVKKGNTCHVSLPCGHAVSVRHNGVYYRWWTVKSNAPTGPDGKFIEKVDLISFC